ncbi:MAG: H+transporting two-sector ATPase C subunit [Anaerolineae bacterium]|nr:H+transporting two-sector ATPase C subunit [Anaerolineae bacterium]
MIPAVIYFFRQRYAAPGQATRSLVMGMAGFNALLILMAAGVGFVWLVSPSTAMAAAANAEGVIADPYVTLAAALSTGLAAIGAGIAVSSTGAAAVGTIAQKPESFGRALIFVGLAEGIAIYGLIISFMVLNR